MHQPNSVISQNIMQALMGCVHYIQSFYHYVHSVIVYRTFLGSVKNNRTHSLWNAIVFFRIREYFFSMGSVTIQRTRPDFIFNSRQHGIHLRIILN